VALDFIGTCALVQLFCLLCLVLHISSCYLQAENFENRSISKSYYRQLLMSALSVEHHLC